jgi:pimeloyl-ACP methyl ester carboxylesterase
MHHPLLVALIRIYFAVVGRLFPSLAVASAHKLFHRPVNSKRKYNNEKKVQDPEKFIIPLDESTQLQAYRWGKDTEPIVLLVHGWSTTARSMNHFLEILLKNNYQVISYDALRHGDSKGSLSDLAGWANSVQTVMKSIGPVECIVAHSFGGLSVTVASKLGLETKKLILVAPINNIIWVADNFAKHLGISLNIVKKMRDYTWKNNEQNFLKYGKDWEDIVRSDFHVPTLIFHDKQDREIGIEHSKLLCKTWPWATLRLTDGLGHRSILDDKEVAEELLMFIKE